MYAYIAHMYGNEKSYSRDFNNISQLNNQILDSVATYNMTPPVSDFIPDSLEDTDKYIKVTDGHNII